MDKHAIDLPTEDGGVCLTHKLMHMRTDSRVSAQSCAADVAKSDGPLSRLWSDTMGLNGAHHCFLIGQLAIERSLSGRCPASHLHRLSHFN